MGSAQNTLKFSALITLGFDNFERSVFGTVYSETLGYFHDFATNQIKLCWMLVILRIYYEQISKF